MNDRSKKHLKNFAFLLFTAAILLLLLLYGFRFLWPGLLNVTAPVLSAVVLSAVILPIYFVSIRTVTPQIFIQVVILGTTVKLLLFGAYTFYLIYSDIAHARANILFFFIGYVLLTVLEITSLYKFIRDRSANT